MRRNLMACRILEDAEADLHKVIVSLTSAEPEKLEAAQELLEQMASTLGEIEAAARRDSSLPIQFGLAGLRNGLLRAGSLSSIALSSLDRQARLAGLVQESSEPTLYAEG